MDMIVPAVIGDIVSRAVSFAIKKCLQLPGDVEKNLERLNQLLLRAHTITEEAEGRLINNREMLQQLGILMEGMQRGHYMLDNFKRPALQEERGDEQQITTPWRFPDRTNSSKSKIAVVDSCQDALCAIAYSVDERFDALKGEGGEPEHAVGRKKSSLKAAFDLCVKAAFAE